MVFDYGSMTSLTYTKWYCDSDKKAKLIYYSNRSEARKTIKIPELYH